MTNKPLLSVEHLKKHFVSSKGTLHAVDDISFQLEKGRTLGIVGESGCGKSTIGRTVLRLLEPTSGHVYFEGTDIYSLKRSQMRALRKDMQIVFQDPFASLDPHQTVAEIIAEPLKVHKLCKDKAQLEQRVLELMETVGLAERLYQAYPHELDGGRRQRIGIARALALDPKLIVCDEPVSALDVSIQAQILNLLKKLQEERGLTYMFITHDLSVVNYFADDIMVMYLGRLLEKTDSDTLFASPLHPYTQALLSAIPSVNILEKRERIILQGELTSPIDPPNACRFASRCPKATERCFQEEPELREVEPNHFVACFAIGQQ